MELFHGSNLPVRAPQLLTANRRLDFGPGFYVTSDFDQAARWARLKTLRENSGRPIVSHFRIDDTTLSLLEIRSFHTADARWLRYVVANRKGLPPHETADIVAGPVANDQTMPTIARYMVGDLTISEALHRLRPQDLKDQYLFRTTRALKLLVFVEVVKAEEKR